MGENPSNISNNTTSLYSVHLEKEFDILARAWGGCGMGDHVT